MIIAALVLCYIGFEAETPIPDPLALLKDAQAHQSQMDAIRENYTFHRMRRVEEVDKNGAVQKTTTFEREVFFVNGRQIGRLIKKNGKALTAEEEKAEQARVTKVVETMMKTPPKARQARGGLGLIADILAVARISNPRRLPLKGRDTLAYDFIGDPQAHVADPHDTMQNAAKKMAGTIWFDEADHQVARLEITLDSNFKIGGGLLASVRKGTTMVVEQAPVGDGLWMQTASEQYLNARIVIKGVREKVRIEDSDFKKFNVETVQRIGSPSQ